MPANADDGITTAGVLTGVAIGVGGALLFLSLLALCRRCLNIEQRRRQERRRLENKLKSLEVDPIRKTDNGEITYKCLMKISISFFAFRKKLSLGVQFLFEPRLAIALVDRSSSKLQATVQEHGAGGLFGCQLGGVQMRLRCHSLAL